VYAVTARATVVLLVMHLTLGCCGHHEHACPPSVATSQSAEAAGNHDDTDTAPSHTHEGPDHCKSPACVFLARGIAGRVAFTAAPALSAAMHNAPQTALRGRPFRLAEYRIDCRHWPLPLHLLNQVLLI
jgi:hypothetical protein